MIMVSILLVPNLHLFINIIQYPVLLQVNIKIPVPVLEQPQEVVSVGSKAHKEGKHMQLGPSWPPEVGTIIDVEETRVSYHLSPQFHPHIVGLKPTGVWCQPLHWSHCCKTGQKAPSIQREVGNVGKPEPIWKLIYPSLKTRIQRMLWPTKVGGGIWQYTIVWDARIVHSSCMPFVPCKVTPEN